MLDNNYLFTTDELAAILKVSRKIVYDLIKKGHLKAVKLGRIKVTKFELLKFLRDYDGKDLTDMDNVKDFKL